MQWAIACNHHEQQRSSARSPAPPPPCPSAPPPPPLPASSSLLHGLVVVPLAVQKISVLPADACLRARVYLRPGRGPRARRKVRECGNRELRDEQIEGRGREWWVARGQLLKRAGQEAPLRQKLVGQQAGDKSASKRCQQLPGPHLAPKHRQHQHAGGRSRGGGGKQAREAERRGRHLLRLPHSHGQLVRSALVQSFQLLTERLLDQPGHSSTGVGCRREVGGDWRACMRGRGVRRGQGWLERARSKVSSAGQARCASSCWAATVAEKLRS